MPSDTSPTSVQEIIKLYYDVTIGVKQEAEVQDGTRAFGGVVRMKKGQMVENIGKSIISMEEFGWGSGQVVIQ